MLLILKLRDKVKGSEKAQVSSKLRPRKDKANDKKEKFQIHLSDEERQKAENLLVCAIQNCEFEKEILSLIKLGIFAPNSVNDMKIKNSKLAASVSYTHLTLPTILLV